MNERIIRDTAILLHEARVLRMHGVLPERYGGRFTEEELDLEWFPYLSGCHLASIDRARMFGPCTTSSSRPAVGRSTTHLGGRVASRFPFRFLTVQS